MRGTRRLYPSEGGCGGIIPAHAGNTGQIVTVVGSVGDHPRACGEHHVMLVRLPYVQGSSPRMRGTPGENLAKILLLGIIPAHAGNTFRSVQTDAKDRDHPRACGEHVASASTLIMSSGSSPRMRGTHFTVTLAAPCAGIIPAHAGNTGGYRRDHRLEWDHPRACGEHPARRRC